MLFTLGVGLGAFYVWQFMKHLELEMAAVDDHDEENGRDGR